MRVITIQPHFSGDAVCHPRDDEYELEGLELELRLKDGIVADPKRGLDPAFLAKRPDPAQPTAPPAPSA